MCFVMSEENTHIKNPLDMEIDLDLALNVADKVTNFLDTRIEDPFERYLVTRLISILYEEKWNFSLDPEFESEVRQLAKEKPDNTSEID
jgi:hypothetical protein